MLVGITGSNGWIGRYMVQKLTVPLRLFQRQFAEIDSGFPCVVGELSQPTAALPFLKGLDALIHLAWSSHPRKDTTSIQENLAQNLIVSTGLFEEFGKTCPGGHLIFASTGGNMYADGAPFIARTERDVPEPRSLYSAQKLGAEAILRLLCQRYGFRATILRIGNPYGTLLSTQRTQGLVGVALAKLEQQEPLVLYESIEAVRDYIHLSDVSSAIETVIQNPPDLGECALFHVSTGKGKTTREVLQTLEALSGKSFILHQTAEGLKAKPSWSVLSSDKLQSELGWAPLIDFETGLEALLMARAL